MDHSGEALEGRIKKLCSPNTRQKACTLKAEGKTSKDLKHLVPDCWLQVILVLTWKIKLALN